MIKKYSVEIEMDEHGEVLITGAKVSFGQEMELDTSIDRVPFQALAAALAGFPPLEG